jgi:TLD
MRRRDRSNEHFQWLNMHAFGVPHGIGLGGTEEGYRIFIPDTFENCRASDSCLTFEGGALMPDISTTESEKWSSGKYHFEIDQLEVWACGGPEAIKHGMQVQEHERALREENIQKARKVDKAQFLDNAFDKEFLLSKTFAHKAQIDRDHTDA